MPEESGEAHVAWAAALRTTSLCLARSKETAPPRSNDALAGVRTVPDLNIDNAHWAGDGVAAREQCKELLCWRVCDTTTRTDLGARTYALGLSKDKHIAE